MDKYVGKICPYCKTVFQPGDDLVVCSDCDMPHHKECWVENQGCTTFGCSGTIKAVVPEFRICYEEPVPDKAAREPYLDVPPVEPPVVAEPIAPAIPQSVVPAAPAPVAETPVFCTRCGTKSKEGDAFCLHCGNRLRSEVQPVASAPAAAPVAPTAPQPVAPVVPVPAVPAPAAEAPVVFCTQCGTKNKAGDSFCVHCGRRMMSAAQAAVPSVSPVVSVRQQPVPQPYEAAGSSALVRHLIGPKAEYYIPIFRQIDTGDKKHSWNWAAFLVPAYWLLYRKMYRFGAAVMAISFLTNQSNSDFLFLLGFVGNIALALYANYIYLRELQRKAEQASFLSEPERTQYLLKNGGVSSSAMAIGLLVYLVIANVLS